jgi:membrane-bound lytic murein transglycosylase D
VEPLSELATTREPEPAAVADPSQLPWAPRRYEVAADGSIVVRPEETLGHYADWLEIPTQRLRDLNGLRFGTTLGIGKRVRLDFHNVDRAVFEARRLEHHRSLQTAFFDDFSVAGTDEHVLRRGDTLWKISRGKYDVPVWLIQQYNPSVDMNALRPGMRIRIPKVERRAKG